MGLRISEGFKRVPKEGSNEVGEEEEYCNGCLKHANEGVCVLLLFVIKDTFSTCVSTRF